jgi:glycosyltransferase involved in cell wall biosynthesis
MTNASADSFCVVIPAYREQGRIGAVVRAVQTYCPAIIVVDDGSEDRTGEEARQAGATVLRNPANLGKGEALAAGFRHARESGFTLVITLDADGQHDPADIPAFLEAHRRTGMPAFVGNRMSNAAHMPLKRRLTNVFMSWLLSRKMGQWVPDTQCGYRLYRCDALEDARTEAPRFAAESEILMRLSLRGFRIGSVPIRVIYGDEKSKIRPLRDAVRFARMLRRMSQLRREAASAPQPR